jgi:hypothetical protein
VLYYLYFNRNCLNNMFYIIKSVFVNFSFIVGYTVLGLIDKFFHSHCYFKNALNLLSHNLKLVHFSHTEENIDCAQI